MKIYNDLDESNFKDDEVDLRELFGIFWKGKWLLISITFLFSIAAVVYSLSLPNIYHSSALLSPVGNQSSMNQALRSYGGLANIAGINLPSSGDASKTDKALEKLESLSFFTENIMPNIHLPDLMAIESWDAVNNTIVYNEKLFNEEKQLWVRDFQYPKNQIPSAQESFKVFKGSLKVVKDNKNGFISISVNHQSPYVAKVWVELIVDQLNYFYRLKDRLEAEAAVDYLNIQIAQTSFTEIKQVIAQLLQQKTQQLTLIEVNDFYVFDYIDPPSVMEEKAEPSRAIICILGALLGGMIGIIVVLINFFFMNRKH
jgi:LPS O-antigen subunit length determinant protein (WzzB/FepE family)